MPIYEYACGKCGHEVELMQKVSDPPPAKCEKCGSKKMSRVVSRTSFQLKGGGWYKDLYSSSTPGKKGESAPPASPPKAEKKGE